MRKLLIDIGNTTIHLKLYETSTKRFLEEKIILTRDVLAKKESVFIDSVFDQAAYSSVVSSIEEQVKHNFKNPKSIVTSTKVQEKDFIYPIHLLGADFIANFYGWNKSNGIIVSLGTATTFSIIKNKKLIGVVIAPGMESSVKGLCINAPALKYDLQEQGKWIEQTKGLFTIDAINMGVINGHYYMIKEMINKIKNEHSIDAVILTGGYTKLLPQNEYEIDRDLIFKGIDNLS